MITKIKIENMRDRDRGRCRVIEPVILLWVLEKLIETVYNQWPDYPISKTSGPTTQFITTSGPTTQFITSGPTTQFPKRPRPAAHMTRCDDSTNRPAGSGPGRHGLFRRSARCPGPEPGSSESRSGPANRPDLSCAGPGPSRRRDHRRKPEWSLSGPAPGPGSRPGDRIWNPQKYYIQVPGNMICQAYARHMV
jgi:hypothetical protein